MAIELTMPALSPTMEKGTLARWLVKVGDCVLPGDIIAEIETDKATMEYEAIDEGVIASIVVLDGRQDVPVGTVLATIAQAGETVPLPKAESPLAITFAKAASQPPTDTHRLGRAANDVPWKRPEEFSEINATPLVKCIAAARGMSLLGIAGSGTDGRILKVDLGLPSLPAPIATPVPGNLPDAGLAPTFGSPTGVPATSVNLTSMRKTIARRLTESKQNVPHFYLTTRCNIDALNRLREELNASLMARGIKLSVNDMLIKAMALAMTQVPDVNVQYGGDVLHRFARVDIAMAVAVEGGLITPVIRSAGTLSLAAIARASKNLASEARDGKLLLEDYVGGTASISNLGMYRIDEMLPVINPPQALILGVGAGIEQPWKVSGQIALATIMAATASFDHRAIDGATAAQFMATLRDLIEDPMQMAC